MSDKIAEFLLRIPPLLVVAVLMGFIFIGLYMSDGSR